MVMSSRAGIRLSSSVLLAWVLFDARKRVQRLQLFSSIGGRSRRTVCNQVRYIAPLLHTEDMNAADILAESRRVLCQSSLESHNRRNWILLCFGMVERSLGMRGESATSQSIRNLCLVDFCSVRTAETVSSHLSGVEVEGDSVSGHSCGWYVVKFIGEPRR